ncbi:MAG: hypothetical protein KAR40_17445, partial [Candidatus Sabulitectum sp.]|nr:hypothetical protein [Candidatus Sabulitectum sp.]
GNWQSYLDNYAKAQSQTGRRISRRLSSAKLPTPNLDDNILQSLISGITVFICPADSLEFTRIYCRNNSE